MATIANSLVSQTNQVLNNNAVQYTWAAIPNGTAGAPIGGPGFFTRCVQFTGTWGSNGTAVLEGSNDGTNWFTLKDPNGNNVSANANAMFAVSTPCYYIRPHVTNGDATTAITIVLVCVSFNPN